MNKKGQGMCHGTHAVTPVASSSQKARRSNPALHGTGGRSEFGWGEEPVGLLLHRCHDRPSIFLSELQHRGGSRAARRHRLAVLFCRFPIRISLVPGFHCSKAKGRAGEPLLQTVFSSNRILSPFRPSLSSLDLHHANRAFLEVGLFGDRIVGVESDQVD